MMGDYHVRFCERLGVKIPLSTRCQAVLKHLTKMSRMNKKQELTLLNKEVEYLEIEYSEKMSLNKEDSIAQAISKFKEIFKDNEYDFLLDSPLEIKVKKIILPVQLNRNLIIRRNLKNLDNLLLRLKRKTFLFQKYQLDYLWMKIRLTNLILIDFLLIHTKEWIQQKLKYMRQRKLLTI
jgi:hypothetical protein